MKMRKMLAMVAMASVAAMASAADVSAVSTSPATPGARARPLRRRPAKPSGGYLLKKIEGPVVAVRNRQSAFSASEVRAAVEKAMYALYLPVVLVGADETRGDIATEVVLVDHPSRTGFTLLVAPEQGFAELATDWLVADSPAPEKRTARLDAELLRAVASTFGCGVSMYQPDLMGHVLSLRDLDRMGGRQLGPASCNVIDEAAKRRNISRIVVASYRKACEEGWAPAPTNDVQRAIWDEIHAIPSAPMKIEFDPKKGR